MNSKQALKQVQEISALLSIFGNLLLILLIITKSPKKLGSYKYLMIYISVFEILFSSLDVVLRPIIISHLSILICISTNFKITKNVSLCLISIWGGFFGSFMGLFALQFIYRYLFVCKSRILKSFNDSRIVLWMLIPLSFGIIWGLVVYILLPPNSSIDHDIKSIVKEEFNWDIEDVSYIGPYIYPKSGNGEMTIDMKSLIAIIIKWTLVNTSIFTVVFFAVKCYSELNSTKNSSQSSKLNYLQHQLFYALLMQTFIPFILMHLPVSILFIYIFNLDLGNASALVTMLVAIFPALDPFPVILIIKSYRSAIADVVTIGVKFLSRREHSSRNENDCESRF